MLVTNNMAFLYRLPNPYTFSKQEEEWGAMHSICEQRSVCFLHIPCEARVPQVYRTLRAAVWQRRVTVSAA